MNRLPHYLSWSQPIKVKLMVLGVVTLCYLAFFLIFVSSVENYPVAATAAFLPVIVGGLLFGAAGGLVYGILIVIAMYLFGMMAGYQFVSVIATIWGNIFLIISGVGAGWLREQLSAREKIQRELLASEERLRSVVTNAPVILFALDGDGKFTLSEGSGLASLNLKPGEAVGQSVFELFARAPGFLDEIRRALRGETFTSISRGQGLAFETRYSPLYDTDGQLIGTTGVSIDILSRIEAEESYRILVETSVQGLAILQDSRIVFANAAQAEMTGYSVEELVGMEPDQILTLTHPDDRDMIAERLGSVANHELVPKRVEMRLLRKDESIRWVEMYHAAITYHGRPASQMVTLDITERKQMAAAVTETETLRLELDQQRELKELKSRFISMVSHQFRTPMSVISTTGYLLENYFDKLAPEKREEYFGKIRSQIDRLDELIENVLTISQNEEKGLAFTPSLIDLEAYCNDIVAEMGFTSPLLHKLIFVADGDLTRATVDEKLVRNILTNLLSNAIKYSPDGGEVLFRLERQGDEAVFQISDSGIGITPEDQKHMFEPFHRGQNVTGIKGSGLGLKIVKDFVDIHGGTISFSSEPGKGTMFTVRLPIEQHEIQPEIQGEDEITRSSGGA